MPRVILIVFSLMTSSFVFGQGNNSLASKVGLGAYGEINYNQDLSSENSTIGELDVQRLVLLTSYKFNEDISFFGEIEFEHVKEVLTPHGIINERHESPTFHGVERPFIDNKVIPSTWREIGAGINGKLPQASSSFQVYVMNGLLGYDDSGKLGGSSGLRGGRQKGAESVISSPNLAANYTYYGIKGLRLGASSYLGRTQSTLFDGIDKSNQVLQNQADSSTVGLFLAAVNANYAHDGLELIGQLYSNTLSNTKQYNEFTNRDIGSRMTGAYSVVAYNILQKSDTKNELSPFVRYEIWNLHSKTNGITANPAYDNNAIIAGFGFKPNPGLAFKIDVQSQKNSADNERKNGLNLGLGFAF